MPRCAIGRWLDELDKADRQAAEAALENPEWDHTNLHRTFKEAGLEAGVTTMRTHRSKECACVAQ